MRNESVVIHNNKYNGIDFIKYIAAIMIICIHCDAVIEIPFYNFILKNIVCRIAVPYFFIATGFFFRKNSLKSKNYLKKYLISLGKSYLIWSLVFLPLGIDWISQNMDLPGYLYPVALIAGLLYVGTFYHLWYIPALFFGIIAVNYLYKKIGPRILIIEGIA